MENTSNIFLLLASLTEPYPSKPLIKKLYNSFENFPALFSADLQTLSPKLKKEELEKVNEIKTAIKKCNLGEIKKSMDKSHIKFLAYCDKEYPQKLKDINDPPFGFFYKGDISILRDSKAVAIVGTRAATNYGLNITKKIASLLTEQNITVISGLASGIDTASHIGALKSGKTVAVLGTGVDIVFPASNRDLFKEMLDKGSLVLSEYPPGTEGAPWNFPQRNRIISALSDAVVVIEGDLQSGALITARFAIKQEKPLFALPGPIDSPASNGPNILIKSGVAELLTSVQDILEKIGESKQIKLDVKDDDAKLEELNENQKNIYRFLSSESKSFDSLIQETNLNVQDLLKDLSILELKGLVEKLPDGGYVSL
ncbi:MAG: DNA-protecting protein DprA [Candidatus Melainabacteria bacterium]|nr:DNA-protecting protein DprA [Candidatus Melainabacteria bacterium]